MSAKIPSRIMADHMITPMFACFKKLRYCEVPLEFALLIKRSDSEMMKLTLNGAAIRDINPGEGRSGNDAMRVKMWCHGPSPGHAMTSAYMADQASVAMRIATHVHVTPCSKPIKSSGMAMKASAKSGTYKPQMTGCLNWRNISWTAG